MQLISDDKVEFKKATLFFNSNYNWDLIEESADLDYKSRYHPCDDTRQFIGHELAHLIHVKDNPRLSAINQYTIPTPEQMSLIREVGEHATKNLDEFIAEFASSVILGAKYSNAVNNLYKEAGGFKIF